MGRRVWCRAPKVAGEPVSAAQALASDLIFGNSGNLLFATSTMSFLSASGAEVHPSRDSAGGAHLAARINAEFDLVVLPMANAFRPGFAPQLDQLTAMIERLDIPVVVVGVGAQIGLDGDTAPLRDIAGNVRGFCRAVLDRSASIGVRGAHTAGYLAELGIGPVDVIGCPSMFLLGPTLEVHRRESVLGADSPLALNGQPGVPLMRQIVQAHVQRYREAVFVAQSRSELDRLVDPGALSRSGVHRREPTHPDHRMYREGRVRLFLDLQPWLSFLAGRSFSFGARIHGNIAALLAGTPACVLAHDARTLELSEYFEIPHVRLTDIDRSLDAARLYDELDLEPLLSGHPARFAAFVAFLERNGVPHGFPTDATVTGAHHPSGPEHAAATVRPARVQGPPGP